MLFYGAATNADKPCQTIDLEHLLTRKLCDHAHHDAIFSYRGKTILVSGAGGTVGSELCRQLILLDPKRIVLIDISEIALYTIERDILARHPDTSVEIVAVLGSVTDAQLVRRAISGNAVDVVVHAAAFKHVALVERNPIAGFSNNVLGTVTLATAAVDAGVGRFVLISTDKAVSPTSVMGVTKRLAELAIEGLAAKSRRTQFSTVRFGNVIASSGSVLPLFQQQIAAGGPLTLTHYDVTRYFMTVSEAAQLVLLAGSYADGRPPQNCAVFVLDMGHPVSIREIALCVIKAAGRSVRDATNPGGDIGIVLTGLHPGEKLHEEPLMSGDLLPTRHNMIWRLPTCAGALADIATALGALQTAVIDDDADRALTIAELVVPGYRRSVMAAQMAVRVCPS